MLQVTAGGANDGTVKVRNPRRRRSLPPLHDVRETQDNLWIVAGTKILENRRFIARALLLSSIASLIPTWLWYNVILMRVSSYLQESFLPCPLVYILFFLFFLSLHVYIQQQDYFASIKFFKSFIFISFPYDFILAVKSICNNLSRFLINRPYISLLVFQHRNISSLLNKKIQRYRELDCP